MGIFSNPSRLSKSTLAQSTLSKVTFWAATATLLSACQSYDYQAKIRYSDDGVPHISAKDYASLGYAVGYDHARENVCTLAEQLINLQSQKSRYHGVGIANKNLLMDIGYKALDLPAKAERDFATLNSTAQDLLSGYSDGFNAQLAERKLPDDLPSACRGAQWVKPITPELLLAYHLDLALLASGRNFTSAIAAAHPPAENLVSMNRVNAKPDLIADLNAENVFTSEGIGSNGWALGKDRVEGAKGALIANPHFPWDGELRFYQQHLTIPGELNINGVGMIGVPGVSVGFNKDLAWTHTVSQSKRFTFYQLELDPKNPMRYRYGKEFRDIRKQAISIDVKQSDGSVEPYEHTLYFSHYGPMLNLSSLSPSLGWSKQSALSYRDANESNTGMLEQWMAMAKASNADEFFEAFNDHQAIPWVNTIMVDKQGVAAYLDGTQVPSLSAKAEAYWRAASQKPALAAMWRDGAGSMILPGSDPAFEWTPTSGARMSGLVPFSEAPSLRRDDYVFNANSSHWLSNLEQPLEGYSIAYGPEQTHRSPRTRFNAQLISDTSKNSLGGRDGKFDFDELKNVFTHNGSLFANELLPQLRQRCHGTQAVSVAGQVVELAETCEALDKWDGLYQLDSQGAHVMREFLAQYRVKGHRDLSDELFANKFDPTNAAFTPAQLAQATSGQADPVLQALARASLRLNSVNIPLDAKLGDIQAVHKAPNQAPIPVTGGYSYEGVFNFAQARANNRGNSELALVDIGSASKAAVATPMRVVSTADGSQASYPVNYGSSFVMALEFNEQGPHAEMFLSYSQGHDPESPHFRDQSDRFSRLEWRPMSFTEKEVAKNTVKVITLNAMKPKP